MPFVFAPVDISLDGARGADASPLASAPATARELVGSAPTSSLQSGTSTVAIASTRRPSYEQVVRDVAADSTTWYSMVAIVLIGRLLWATARTMVRGDGSSEPSRSSG